MEHGSRRRRFWVLVQSSEREPCLERGAFCLGMFYHSPFSQETRPSEFGCGLVGQAASNRSPVVSLWNHETSKVRALKSKRHITEGCRYCSHLFHRPQYATRWRGEC